jgi:hypothetical protein
MRWLICFLIAACSGHGSAPSDAGCPGPDPGSSGDTTAGTPCTQDGQLCFVENQFSSCASGWYRCAAGKWSRDHGLGAAPGQSCAGAPILSCTVEGNPDCTTNPTAEWCDCGSDGLWHCGCACYGGTCDYACPPDFPGIGSNGPACAGAGSCAYSGHTCTCESNGHFSCN